MKATTVRYPIGEQPPKATLYYGVSVLEGLRHLPEDTIQTVCTSPPYWGLRKYPLPEQEWGDGWTGQLGLEPSPELYVRHLVEVFQEVRRVLRPDGTAYLNIADSYMSHPAKNLQNLGGFTGDRIRRDDNLRQSLSSSHRPNPRDIGLKNKDLVGIPWRVALALQEDGWWLRNAIVWSKTNHLPSSVQDRFTCGYEFIFLFSASDRYYFDLDAVRIPYTYGSYESGQFVPAQSWFETGKDHRKWDQIEGQKGQLAGPPRRFSKGLYRSDGKNPGDVWELPTQPYPGGHFAAFPEAIPERCILAGTSEKGCCPKCKAPWRRIIQKGNKTTARGGTGHSQSYTDDFRMGTESRKSGVSASRKASGVGFECRVRKTVGWKPTCDCGEKQTDPCVVLDPFSGSATTGQVALRLGRDYIGVDLAKEYLPLAKARLLGQKPPLGDNDEDNPIGDLFGAGD